MDSCVFCEILRGNAEGSVVYEDEACVALMDIQPVNLGHILVIPRVHASCLSELAENTGAKMFLTIAQPRQMLVLKGLEKAD